VAIVFQIVRRCGRCIIDYRAPPGASLTETYRLMRLVEAIVQKIPELQICSRRSSLGLGGDLNESNEDHGLITAEEHDRKRTDLLRSW